MPPRVRSLSWAALAACVLTPGLCGASTETRYTGFFVCSVKPTSDGFVALRSGPSAQSRMITRIVPGEMVVIERKGYVAIESGNWSRVSQYPGEVFPKPGDPAYKNVRRGWVNSRFIAECG